MPVSARRATVWHHHRRTRLLVLSLPNDGDGNCNFVTAKQVGSVDGTIFEKSWSSVIWSRIPFKPCGGRVEGVRPTHTQPGSRVPSSGGSEPGGVEYRGKNVRHLYIKISPGAKQKRCRSVCGLVCGFWIFTTEAVLKIYRKKIKKVNKGSGGYFVQR